MGTWDAGSFGNDAALDFLQSVEGVEGISAPLRAQTAYLDADAACEAVAACELVATMMRRPAPDVPEDALSRFGELPRPDDALIESARAMLVRVREGSELADLWAEEDDGEWRDAIEGLLNRLDPDFDYALPEKPADPPGAVYALCFFCEGSVPEVEAVDLIHEIDDGIIFSTMTMHAHRTCAERKFEPPHWNADGTPSEEMLAQFGALVGAEPGT